MTDIQIQIFIMVLTNLIMVTGGYLLGSIATQREMMKIFERATMMMAKVKIREVELGEKKNAKSTR